jgi:PIN domain nuclease of toxin-antitoxin system
LRLLLDTHALIWWFLDDPKMTPAARAAIGSEEAEVFVSAVSGYEIVSKFTRGKLPQVAFLAANLDGMLAAEGFGTLPLSLPHATLAGSLPLHHRDPFDRLLIAQAVVEELVLVSNERAFDQAGVSRLW